jgi:signal peptidase I
MREPELIDLADSEWDSASEPTARDRWKRWLGEFLQTIIIAALLFLVVNLLTARIRVEGDSMEPTLHNNEFVVVNKLAYFRGAPERGDIVVFRFPLDPARRFVKRIIALPAETVHVEDGQVFVDGVRLDEPYVAAQPRYDGDWVVDEGEVFVLGDNRNNSSDSQNWGNLPIDDIIGRAEIVYWPPSEIGVVHHYTYPGLP